MPNTGNPWNQILKGFQILAVKETEIERKEKKHANSGKYAITV